MKLKQDKIKPKYKIKNFFKKIYYSVFKINKYPDMVSEGIKKASIYIRNIVFILGAIYATILAIYGMKNMQKIMEYLNEKLPNVVYEDGILRQENETRIVLDDDLIINNLGEVIIIDTMQDLQSIKEEFTDYAQPAIIFASEKCIQIDEMGRMKEYEYESVFNKLTEKGYSKIGKNEIIYLIGNVNYPTYFVRLALSYLLVCFIYVFGYCLITTIILYFCFKRDKIFSFGEIYTTCLYASTVLTFGFMLVALNVFNLGAVLEVLFLILTFIYAIRGVNYIKNHKHFKIYKNK